jgi:hypothetical protein
MCRNARSEFQSVPNVFSLLGILSPKVFYNLGTRFRIKPYPSWAFFKSLKGFLKIRYSCGVTLRKK